jgi:cytochrome c biogenesis protein CcdA/glutaredoxin
MRCILQPALILLLLAIGLVSAGTEVILIGSPGCHKCAAAEQALERALLDQPEMTLVKYDYFSDQGRLIIKEHKVRDVPAIVIGQAVINYRDYSGDGGKLEQLIKSALSQSADGENQSLRNQSATGAPGGEINLQDMSIYTLFAVLAAGLLAGFNPCLLGVLVFLAASVLSSSGRRRELVMLVLFFSLGIFAVYLLFGLGMQRLLQMGALESFFRYILTVFLVVIGLMHILDAAKLSRGGESLFRTDWALGYFLAGIERGRLSSYFLIGALFSLVKAPCIVGVYLAILDLISARSYLEGTVYLTLYNLGVILPVLLLGGFIILGMSPEQVDRWRKDYRAGIRLATGLALLLLAPLIYWQAV